ncbi:MAG: hypothetical protein SFU86_21855 [Pirellulaceae bacterium]|nr:hypothetical protein [Pirellulaceae bacterium]
MNHHHILALAASLAWASSTGWSAEAKTESAQNEASRWLEQLDGSEFAQRQEASQKLSEAGRQVFPELEKAAETGTREVATRAIDILKRHFERGDSETKAAAEAALQRLSKSTNKSASQRAIAALTPPQQGQPMFGGIPVANLPIRLNNIQIQGMAPRIGNAGGGAIVRRVHIRQANGKREIEVEEGDRKVKIESTPAGIQAEITEKINGQETTRKVDAKDLDDLKKKDPALARIYEQHTPGNGNMQIQANGIPGLQPAPPAVPAGDAKEQMIKRLDDTIARLKAQAQARPNPSIDRFIESLEQQKQRLQGNAGEGK